MIDHADARVWLEECEKADLILTDPPHLDNYLPGGALYGESHLDFTRAWIPKAMNALAPGGTLVHSCGAQPAELGSYLATLFPAQLLVWPFDADTGKPGQGDHHFFLVYHHTPTPLTLTSAAIVAEKPHPLYFNLIHAFAPMGKHVVDPFAGRGEIPAAAREGGYTWAGCDINEESVAAANARGL